MVSRRADGPLLVQLPGPTQDRPSWKTVAIIAAVGFAVGILWPRFAGVRLGPSLPDVSTPAGASSASATRPGPSASQAPGSLPSVATVGSVPTGVVTGHTSSSPPSSAGVGVPPRDAITKPAEAPTDHLSSALASASARSDGSPEGIAQVVWEVALIRDAPKTGRVIARLQRGSSLRIGLAKDGWYPVRYGEGYSSDGWVYRGAIGR